MQIFIIVLSLYSSPSFIEQFYSMAMTKKLILTRTILRLCNTQSNQPRRFLLSFCHSILVRPLLTSQLVQELNVMTKKLILTRILPRLCQTQPNQPCRFSLMFYPSFNTDLWVQHLADVLGW